MKNAARHDRDRVDRERRPAQGLRAAAAAHHRGPVAQERDVVRLPWDVQEDGRQHAPIGPGDVDGDHQHERFAGVHRVGERQDQQDAHDEREPGQDPDQQAGHDAEEDQQPEGHAPHRLDHLAEQFHGSAHRIPSRS